VRHARAAVAAAAETNQPVILLSAPAAAAAGGPAWFGALVGAACREHPATQVTAILDCGHFAGYALAALRHGLTAIRYDGAAFSALAAIAAETGATLVRTRPEALDLASIYDDVAPLQEACRHWLAEGARD
jgi:fructose/tagatose bisphosphate aldolase